MSFELEERHYQQITEFSELGFTWREIATVMQLNVRAFRTEWLNERSLVRQYYDAGVLNIKADLQLKKTADARAGNITMIQIIDREEELRRVQELKEKHLYDG